MAECSKMCLHAFACMCTTTYTYSRTDKHIRTCTHIDIHTPYTNTHDYGNFVYTHMYACTRSVRVYWLHNLHRLHFLQWYTTPSQHQYWQWYNKCQYNTNILADMHKRKMITHKYVDYIQVYNNTNCFTRAPRECSSSL